MKSITAVALLVAVACVALTWHLLVGRGRSAPPAGPATVELTSSSSSQRAEVEKSSIITPASTVKRHARLPDNEFPSHGASWTELYQALMPLAMNGDSAAASHLFRRTMHCSEFANAGETFNAMWRMYPDTSRLSPLVLENYEQRLAELQRKLKVFAPVCKNFDPAVLQDALYPIMRQAAVLGDAVAAPCYVRAYQFQHGDYTEAEKSAMKADYARHVLEITQTGVENGNWDMVGLLWPAYNRVPKQFESDSWLGDVIEPDMLSYYAYALLVRHGLLAREDISKARFDAFASLLGRVRATNEFSATELASAEAWADETYAAYFAGHPYPQGDDANLCVVP